MREQFYDNITNFIFVENEPEKADVIFVPGNGYPHMAEHAAALWKQGYAPYILPSGKYSITLGHFAGVQKKENLYTGLYDTECEFLTDVLKKNGVSVNAILKEDQATFTYENAYYSSLQLKKMNLIPQRAIICCCSTHARRCKMYYELFFPHTDFIICPVPAEGITKTNWFQSDVGINTVLSEMDRCGRQFEHILKTLPEYPELTQET